MTFIVSTFDLKGNAALHFSDDAEQVAGEGWARRRARVPLRPQRNIFSWRASTLLKQVA